MYTLALVWLGFLQGPNFRGGLADGALINAAHLDGALFNGNGNAFRNAPAHRQSVTKVEHELLASFKYCAVADALDFQNFRVALGDASDRVLSQRPEGTQHCFILQSLP